MKRLSEKEAIELLKKYAPTKEAFEKVLTHSKKVRDIALSLTKHLNDFDKDLLNIGALLHDIGRFKYPPGSKDSILHGVEGGRILRDLGYDQYARICETHIGVGITKEDILAQRLPLPLKDYIPKTKEEIIIAYADNLDSPGIEDEMDVEERFAREVGELYREKVRKFHEKVHQILQR